MRTQLTCFLCGFVCMGSLTQFANTLDERTPKESALEFLEGANEEVVILRGIHDDLSVRLGALEEKLALLAKALSEIVEAPEPPEPPVPIPVSGEATLGWEPVTKRTDGTPLSGQVNYRVTVELCSGGGRQVIPTLETSVVVQGLQMGVEYCWSVLAIDDMGIEGAGAVGPKFVVQDDDPGEPPPEPPTNDAPTSFRYDPTLGAGAIRWDDVEGAVWALRWVNADGSTGTRPGREHPFLFTSATGRSYWVARQYDDGTLGAEAGPVVVP